MAGYSGTPLARKLGIKEGSALYLKHAPEHYFDLFSDLPSEVNVLKRPKPQSVDLVHLFCRSEAVLIVESPKLKPLLKINGMFWVSWPKGSSPFASDLNRETVREFILSELGLVDVKVAAIDADWSALKFVYRSKDR